MSALDYVINNGVLKARIGSDNTLEEIEAVKNVLAENSGVSVIGLDLYKCSYLQSKALAALLDLKKAAMAKKVSIELLNAGEDILSILQMTNLQKLFLFRDDYSAFSVRDLCESFLDAEKAEEVSDYLAANYDENIQKTLVEIIKDGDPILVEYAILTMGRAQDFANVEIFRNALDAKEASVKVAAILVLGWIGDTSSKERLYSYITSGEINVPEAAAASIALLADDTDSEKMAKYLLESDPNIRLAAIYALSLINDNKAYKSLSNLLETEKDEKVRVALVRKIALFNNSEASNVLLNLLDDGSIAVKEAAASGISRRGAGEFAKQLLEKVLDTDSWVGFFAAKSLAGVSDVSVVRKLEEYYGKVEQNVKLAVIEALGKCEATDTKFLIDNLDDDNEDIRKEILNALKTLNDSEALKAALRLYNRDESWLVRYQAVSIILSLKPEGYEALLRERIKHEDNKYIIENIIGEIGE